ncbi:MULTISPECIES: SAV_6107 family HEPN domain-containing protein [unclassified Streptomyces]|uniref:SAV_6107 family HEPN domain-containing protein n=1 Tax=unclassified Streptomyces TaxID=2593676 RepID=UPI002DDC48A7|nr:MULTISPECIES: SAV_6107 family HEPN domain-containing protein [unclassified Streptomyces]WSB79735.1 SAV_6107 family HEPN domain-containing protein [Streptomyces sp. NBC_01775]WSS12059.1 SAV_6107 family HEPN domain-containing protein [Streptomyces sp. NBC_01186]WSS40773.1 SAV_6107 family HEPN domain-containing protein [Streptomyces sp. NBC_01187]
MRPSRGAHPAPPQPTAQPASRTDQVPDIHPVLRRATAPPAALDLLAQAQHGLDEAQAMETANERYATAHLAALRTAAAVLAVRGRPELEPARRRGAPPRRTRRAGIRSAWEVLPEVAPELAEWSALFASGAQRRARAEAGIKGAASWHEADGLVRDAGMFLRLVERMLVSQPALPQPRVAPGDEQLTRHPPPDRRAG